MQLIDRFKVLHELGYVHLDLKPENITLQTDNLLRPESSIICLIDFGISRRYLNNDGSHKKFTTDVAYRGNLMFTSPNALQNYGNSLIL